mmetsp:Transcript_14484/g.16922  ORF Transcript_14484/g.16922 Transcript_14484/m.16922 type:complete len:254 (-) Transcript_14484:1147-1908(-)
MSNRPTGTAKGGRSVGRSIELAALLGASLYYGKHISEKWGQQKQLADLLLTISDENEPQPLPPVMENAAAKMLSESFLNSPAYLCIFKGSAEQRRANLEWLFSKNISVLRSLTQGNNKDIQLWCMLSKENSKISVKSFVMLIHCNRKFSSWDYIWNGFLMAPIQIGSANVKRLFKVADWIEKVEGKVRNGRECMILNRAAVDKRFQGQGIGSKLIRYVLENNPRKDLPCLLETQEKRNIEFYKKLGFQVCLFH